MENKPQFRPDPKLKLPDQVRQVVRYHHYVYRNFLIPSGGRSQGLGFDSAAGLECPGVFVTVLTQTEVVSLLTLLTWLQKAIKAAL